MHFFQHSRYFSVLVAALMLLFAPVSLAEDEGVPGLAAPPPGLLRPMNLPVAAPQTFGMDSDKKITNFWLHIKELLAAEAAKPLPEPKQPGERFANPRTFSFETFETLTTKELMRAVREATRDAREQLTGKPDAEVDRQIEVNIHTVMQFYPLVAYDADAMNNLYYILEDPHAEPVFRRMLYTLSVPGRDNQSLFSMYLQEGLLRDMDRTYRFLGDVCRNRDDRAEIRVLAMQNMRHFMMQEYTALFRKDPVIAELEKTRGTSLTPALLKQADAPKLSQSSKVYFDRLTGRILAFAQLLGEETKANRKNQAIVVQTARELIESLIAEVPFEDPEKVRAFISEDVEAAMEGGDVQAAPPSISSEDDTGLGGLGGA